MPSDDRKGSEAEWTINIKYSVVPNQKYAIWSLQFLNFWTPEAFERLSEAKGSGYAKNNPIINIKG